MSLLERISNQAVKAFLAITIGWTSVRVFHVSMMALSKAGIPWSAAPVKRDIGAISGFSAKQQAALQLEGKMGLARKRANAPVASTPPTPPAGVVGGGGSIEGVRVQMRALRFEISHGGR